MIIEATTLASVLGFCTTQNQYTTKEHKLCSYTRMFDVFKCFRHCGYNDLVHYQATMVYLNDKFNAKLCSTVVQHKNEIDEIQGTN